MADVLPDDNENWLRIDRRVAIPLAEFEFSYARSSGPGGQNVNKVNSKVTLRWNLATSTALPADVAERFRNRFATRITTQGDLLITSQRFADQGRNKADCLEKLRAMVVEVLHPPKQRKATRPSKAAKRRRLEAKRQLSARKQLRRRPPSSDD